jgi:ribosomal protein S6--L-glutamate ligase
MGPVDAGTWADLRPAFTGQISEIAAQGGISLVWHSANWIAELQRDGRSCYLIGYTFPLNNAASAHIAHDKAATCTLLTASGVPAVPHHLLRVPPGASLETAVAMAAATAGLPLVAKPHQESGGIDVCRARSAAELRQVIASLTRRYRAITLSPWLAIDEEYRVVILDKQEYITFRKVRAPGADAGWRHNLRCGAVPELITDGGVRRSLTALAVTAMDTLGLRFAAVDIVLSAGELLVLEVNSAVSLEHFSRHGDSHAQLAARLYREAVERCLS